jgi:hypothetical protein
MRFYKHMFYGVVDLHARSKFIHVLNQQGDSVFAKDLARGPDVILDANVLGCVCIFA